MSNFPEEYKKIVEEEQNIRENCYTKKLFVKDPYYGLIQADAKKFLSPEQRVIFDHVLKILGKGAIIAGGAVVVSEATMIKDVDVFMIGVDSREAEWKVLDMISKFAHKSEHTANFSMFKVGSIDVQIIRRIYTCISELLHGFDIDCCGFAYDGESVWCTERARYSYNHKIIYANPKFASPSWAYRLAKYASRGYKLVLPDFDKKLFDKAAFRKSFEDVFQNDEHATYNDNAFVCNMMITMKDSWRASEMKEKLTPQNILFLGAIYGLYPNMIIAKYRIDSDYMEQKEKDEPKSEPDFIIFKKRFIIRISDPDGIFMALFGTENPQIKDMYTSYTWMTQNPMQQLTGSFNPQEIKDMKEWYIASGCYGKEKEIRFITEDLMYPERRIMIPYNDIPEDFQILCNYMENSKRDTKIDEFAKYLYPGMRSCDTIQESWEQYEQRRKEVGSGGSKRCPKSVRRNKSNDEISEDEDYLLRSVKKKVESDEDEEPIDDRKHPKRSDSESPIPQRKVVRLQKKAVKVEPESDTDEEIEDGKIVLKDIQLSGGDSNLSKVPQKKLKTGKSDTSDESEDEKISIDNIATMLVQGLNLAKTMEKSDSKKSSKMKGDDIMIVEYSTVSKIFDVLNTPDKNVYGEDD